MTRATMVYLSSQPHQESYISWSVQKVIPTEIFQALLMKLILWLQVKICPKENCSPWVKSRACSQNLLGKEVRQISSLNAVYKTLVLTSQRARIIKLQLMLSKNESGYALAGALEMAPGLHFLTTPSARRLHWMKQLCHQIEGFRENALAGMWSCSMGNQRTLIKISQRLQMKKMRMKIQTSQTRRHLK